MTRILTGLVVVAAIACGGSQNRTDSVAVSVPPAVPSTAEPAVPSSDSVALPAADTTPAPSDTSIASRWARADRPAFPIVKENECQGELCKPTQPVVVCRTVALVASPTDSTLTDSVRLNDTLDVQMDLHLKKPGVVVLKRSHALDAMGEDLRATLRLAAGDTVLLLSYGGEGYWRAWHNGHSFGALEEFWGGPGAAMLAPDDNKAKEAIAVGTWPEIDAWLRVSRGEKVLGYWRDDRASPFTEVEYPCPARRPR